MKPLRRGEEELFTISAKSKYGNGEIIVTNFGLAVHTYKDGAMLDLTYKEISEIKNAGKGIVCICWMESSGIENSLNVTTDKSDDACERMLAARMKFDKAQDDAEQKMPVPARSNKVPKHIPDEFVWHDCWYDAARKLYVTLNPYFVQDQNLRKRPHQIEYQEQSGDYRGIVAKKDKARIIAGFPAVRITSQGKPVYMLLPSLTREMITADIAAARHAPAAGQLRIDYFLSE